MKKKSIRKLVRKKISIILLLGMMTNIIFADIKLNPNSKQNTTIDRSQNNAATIININTPNERGISVNEFNEFQTKDPVIFNNFGEGIGRSYLAGLMAANPNLSREQAAQLILNRVGGNNRVEIENYLEVMSNGKTDVVFSSPNGYYLNNIGFINFRDVAFTTANVNLDANGNLMPFGVRGGDITIGRQGINADGLRYLALLSQKINIDGQINGTGADVDLIAGNFDYNPITRDYTKQGANTNELLISATAYGSVYGNIKIVANGGNVGVAGDLISERLLKINADGTIVTGRTQSKEGTEIKAKEYTQTGSTYTEGNLTIEADKVTLNGNGTQANDIIITGNTENYNTIYAKGNITIDKDTKSTGQIIAEKKLDIKGSLDSDELTYGAEEVKVGGDLKNKKELQSEGNISIGKNTTNTGKIIAGNGLEIKGNLDNSGTAYGNTGVTIGKDLKNSGSLQSTGDIKAENTVNTGKVISEKNISTKDLDNSGEITANKQITSSNIDNKTTGKLSAGDTITANGNVANQGSVRTNGSFNISGNFTNYNEILTGGDLTSKDILNSGTLKVSEKITGRGIFTNTGEILTSNLDIDTAGNIINTNKIVVLENSKLKGNNINNAGYISSTNLELRTPTLTNSGRVEVDNKISANNTTLNNVTGGYIGSNQKLELNNSNILNLGILESTSIEMQNLFGYSNGGTSLIRGNDVVLTSTGNLTLTGTLHGENYLQINGLDILNNGTTTGKGYIEVKGRDITNNTELAAGTVVVEGTGNIINNQMITGNNGRIIGFNITNNDLIAFGDQLGLRATNKITNNPGKAIYGGNLLDIEFGDLENNQGELLSLGTMNLRGNYLLNQVGTIQSAGDINLTVTKIDNIGEVTGLNSYEKYYETWDGRILTEAEVMALWLGEEYGENKSNKMDALYRSGLLAALDRADYQFLLANIFLNDIWNLDPTAVDYKNFRQGAVEGYFDNYPMDNGTFIRTSSARFPGVSLKGKIRSNAVTTYSNILAGNNMTINTNELNNMDAKISAGNDAIITAGTIKNQTTLGTAVVLKDGVEYYKQEHYGSGSDRKYHVKYWRGIETGDTAYVTGQASVIEARNLVINTGSLILTPEIDTASQIITGSMTSGTGILAGKITKTGLSNTGTGAIIIQKNMAPLTEIKETGVLPVDPLAAKSSLFTTTTDQTSKYMLETRSKYINLAEFYGSDYFLSRLGYDESNEWNRARRLGDAYYEYLIVTRAISDKLGTRFINGLSDKELMKAMLDNSVDVQKDLQLTVGVSLTPAQVKALKSDIIWYEYEIVDGQKVLVPKVYLSQTTLASIEVDGRNKIGGLELTVINADELRNNGQLIGNGGATYVNAGKVYNVTSTNELSEIKGDQVTVIATAGNIENIGGRIKGIESVALVAENGDVINSSQKITGTNAGGQHESLWSVGEISSEGTTYIAGNNYYSEAGVIGGKDTIINVKDNVTIGSLTLKGNDRSGTSDGENYAIYESTQNIGGVISTDNLYVNGKALNIEGSTVAVSENAILNVKNINIESKVDSVYNESKGSDKGFLSSREQQTKSYEEQNVEGQLFVGGSTLTNADINIIGSTFVTGNDSYLGGNVTATSRELNGYYYHEEKKTGLVSNFDLSSGGVTAGIGMRSTEDTLEVNRKTQAMSNVSLGHGTVVDGDNFDLTATNFQHGAIVINSKEVNYGATKNVYDEKQEHKETYVGISASISSPLLNRIDQMYDGIEAASSGNGTAGYVNGGVAILNSAVGIVNGLSGNQGKKATETEKAKESNNDFYVSASVGLSLSTQESESHSRYETAVVTTIRGLDADSSITYNNTNKITYEGTQSYGDTFIYNNVKEIEKKAVELNNSYTSSSSNTSAYAGTSMTTPSAMNFSISGGNSNYDQNGTSYQNGLFVNVNETYNNVGKVTLDGFEQYGGRVVGDIGEFEIKSKQNTSEINGSSSNYSAGTNTEIIGTTSGGKGIASDGMSSWSAGGSTTNGSRTYVDTPSAFIVGEGSDLSIGKATNTGAIIGTEEGSNGKIKIKEYEGIDLKNSDTYNITGGTVSSGGIGAEYQDKEKEGTTHNTVIGNVVIDKSTGDEINRDINKVQETTKDKDTGHFDFFIESDVLALATKEGREQFKENLGLAGEEIASVGRVIDVTINKQGDDWRNPLAILDEERRNENWRNMGIVDAFSKAQTQEEMANVVKALGAAEGYDVEVIYTDSSNRATLNGNGGASYVDKDGKIIILVNTDQGMTTKGDLAGTLMEELSHGIDTKEGKNKGNGTETLASYSGNYFEGKVVGGSVGLTGDGLNYNDTYFGEHVGDKKIFDPKALKNNYAPEDINKQKFSQAFQEAYGKSYVVDWKKYEKDESYRKMINYDYLQALNFVKDIKELKTGDYIEVPAAEAIYHNYNYSEKNFNILDENSNKKYTSFETGKEAITTPDGKSLVKDPVVAGTFNFFTYTPQDTSDKNAHVADIQTWINWGSGINDFTTKMERIEVFGIGTYISLNYNNIQSWAKKNGVKKVGIKELQQYNKDGFNKFMNDYRKNATVNDFWLYPEMY